MKLFTVQDRGHGKPMDFSFNTGGLDLNLQAATKSCELD